MIPTFSAPKRFFRPLLTSILLAATGSGLFAGAANASSAPTMPSRNESLDSFGLPGLSDGMLAMPNMATQSVALDFIRKTGVSKNLSLLLLHDVKNSALVKAAIRQYGMRSVQETVVEVIKRAQTSYGDDWNQMLARIYMAHFDGYALKSLTVQKDASPYFVQLLNLQDEIASAVKFNGEAIFDKARADVLSEIKAALPT